MDLQDMRDEVRERLGELEQDFFSDEEVDRAINEAVRRFCAEDKWPWLLTEWTSTLAQDNAELDLPENISLTRVFNISLDSDSLAQPVMLERVDPQEGFALRFAYDGHTGTPRWYYITRTNLQADEAPPVTYTAKVIPVPDDDYDVEAQYMAMPVDLGGPSEEPMVPLEYHEALVSWATGKLFLKEFDISQKASEQFTIYSKVLEQAKNDVRSFGLDETVAWGRRHPLNGPWTAPQDVRLRIPPTLGP